MGVDKRVVWIWILILIASLALAYVLRSVEVFRRGGLLMWPILACSIIALTVFIGRAWDLWKAKSNTQKFMVQMESILEKKQIDYAIYSCEKTPSPVARVLWAGLQKYGQDKEEIKEAIEEASTREIPQLERGLRLMAIIAYISPLLGLLGTVLGMIESFGVVQAGGIGQPRLLAGGISQALITTASGLIVAIPTLVAHYYLETQVDSLINEMEEISTELIDTIST